jgi:hypothetical protein
MTISDKNCIQICFGLTLIRVYYIDGEYYLNMVDLEKIHPAIFKKAYQARDFISSILKNESNIDVRFYYRIDIPIEKKIKISECSGWYSDSDNIEKLIHRALLLLIS